MKVKELIEALSLLDKEAEVELVVHQYNKKYPVAYVPIPEANWVYREYPHPFVHMGPWGKVRIEFWLPNNMRTMVLKNQD